jgi:hypothetical protein
VLKVIQGQHNKPKAAVHTAERTGPLKKKLVGGGGQNRPWVLGILINEGVKLRKREKVGLFNFFHSLPYPNNRFENIYVFYLPLFNSIAQKKNYS